MTKLKTEHPPDFNKNYTYEDECYSCGEDYAFWNIEVWKVGLCHTCTAKTVLRLREENTKLKIEQEKYL